MAAATLLAHALLLWSSTDRWCFFYCFKIPEVWVPSMMFKWSTQRKVVGRPGAPRVLVASVTNAMGLVSAVGVAQHLRRSMLRIWSQVPRGLPQRRERRRRSPSPLAGRPSDTVAWEADIVI